MKNVILASLFALLFSSTAEAQWRTHLRDTGIELPFTLYASSDHVTRKTDVGTVTCRILENGTDAACAGSAAEVSDANRPGEWVYNLHANDVDVAGAHSLLFTASGADPVNVPLQVMGYDGLLVSETPNTPTGQATFALESGDVVADDQYNNGYLLIVYNAGGTIVAKSCITDSTDTGDTVVTREDITARTAAGDGYIVDAEQACEGNVARWGGTAIAAVDAAGHPKVTVKDGTGTGEIDSNGGRVAITEAQIDQLVDEVLDEPIGSHAGSGSVGAAITAGGSGGGGTASRKW